MEVGGRVKERKEKVGSRLRSKCIKRKRELKCRRRRRKELFLNEIFSSVMQFVIFKASMPRNSDINPTRGPLRITVCNTFQP